MRDQTRLTSPNVLCPQKDGKSFGIVHDLSTSKHGHDTRLGAPPILEFYADNLGSQVPIRALISL